MNKKERLQLAWQTWMSARQARYDELMETVVSGTPYDRHKEIVKQIDAEQMEVLELEKNEWWMQIDEDVYYIESSCDG